MAKPREDVVEVSPEGSQPELAEVETTKAEAPKEDRLSKRRAYFDRFDETMKASAEGREGINLARVRELVIQKDFNSMTEQERVLWLTTMHITLGLNPNLPVVTFILNKLGKLIPYIERGGTDQLRDIHRVDIQPISEGPEMPGPNGVPMIYVTRVKARLPNGREDYDVGAVPIANALNQVLDPSELANAVKKSKTQASRRATLSILGLGGFVDESEADSTKFTLYLGSDPTPRRIQPQAYLPAAPPQAQPMGQAEYPTASIDPTSGPQAGPASPFPTPAPTSSGWGMTQSPHFSSGTGQGGPLPPPRPPTPAPIMPGIAPGDFEGSGPVAMGPPFYPPPATVPQAPPQAPPRNGGGSRGPVGTPSRRR